MQDYAHKHTMGLSVPQDTRVLTSVDAVHETADKVAIVVWPKLAMLPSYIGWNFFQLKWTNGKLLCLITVKGGL